MTTHRTLAALTIAALATFGANPGALAAAPASPASAAEHASHHPAASESATMAAMKVRLDAMREMHDKMMNAKTPEERNALMADHLKAMQDGMDMMNGMSGMGGMGKDGMGSMSKGGMSGTGAKGPMSGGHGMSTGMAKRHQMMEMRMNMMQMMMQMMMDRMPPSPAKP